MLTEMSRICDAGSQHTDYQRDLKSDNPVLCVFCLYLCDNSDGLVNLSSCSHFGLFADICSKYRDGFQKTVVCMDCHRMMVKCNDFRKQVEESMDRLCVNKWLVNMPSTSRKMCNLEMTAPSLIEIREEPTKRCLIISPRISSLETTLPSLIEIRGEPTEKRFLTILPLTSASPSPIKSKATDTVTSNTSKYIHCYQPTTPTIACTKQYMPHDQLNASTSNTKPYKEVKMSVDTVINSTLTELLNAGSKIPHVTEENSRKSNNPHKPSNFLDSDTSDSKDIERDRREISPQFNEDVDIKQEPECDAQTDNCDEDETPIDINIKEEDDCDKNETLNYVNVKNEVFEMQFEETCSNTEKISEKEEKNPCERKNTYKVRIKKEDKNSPIDKEGRKEEGSIQEGSAEKNSEVIPSVYDCQPLPGAILSKRGAYRYKRVKEEVNLTCTVCNKKLSNKYTLREHMKLHIEMPKKFACDHCKKLFATRANVALHILTVHDYDRSEMEYCVQCDKTFKDSKSLKNHMKVAKAHVGDSKKKLQCSLCSLKFRTNSLLTNHVNYYHLKKTKFTCEPCDKIFPRNALLKRHIARIHDKIPPTKNKVCDVCGRAFATMHILRNHCLTHTKERPLQCERCDATFAHSAALYNHKKHVHKINKKIAHSPVAKCTE